MFFAMQVSIMPVKQACVAPVSDRPLLLCVGDIVIGCCPLVLWILTAVAGRRTLPRRLLVRRVAASVTSR